MMMIVVVVVVVVVTQINVVVDLLSGYCKKMEKELNNIVVTDKETEDIIIKCQKWLLSQNNEMVKKNSTGIYNDYKCYMQGRSQEETTTEAKDPEGVARAPKARERPLKAPFIW